ncbi:MAG: 6-phosphofructokinase, partial [candidate division KSB1 bacterium]|nr:6-phosphofructokinase [candidate division KSB1 bacterium]
MSEHAKKRLAILVGGGPAPGINAVISAATIEARKADMEVVGIMDGFKWLVDDDLDKLREHVRVLHMRDVSRIHFTGGSILRTSRVNPTKDERTVGNCLRAFAHLNVNHVITIGGDDTIYAASRLAAAAQGSIKFAHVPKTIDNDLPLPDNLPTFGFETARHLGSELVKNLMEDSRTTNRWYIIVAMGRKAGHLALGMAKAAGATLAIISEEFPPGPISVQTVCDVLEGAILKRRAMGHEHGVAVVAEGRALAAVRAGAGDDGDDLRGEQRAALSDVQRIEVEPRGDVLDAIGERLAVQAHPTARVAEPIARVRGRVREPRHERALKARVLGHHLAFFVRTREAAQGLRSKARRRDEREVRTATGCAPGAAFAARSGVGRAALAGS